MLNDIKKPVKFVFIRILYKLRVVLGTTKNIFVHKN